VLIYIMFSLNGMRHFGVKSKNKTVRAWPKEDNIIPLGAGCYIVHHALNIFLSLEDSHFDNRK
jgi:hypothetical protein